MDRKQIWVVLFALIRENGRRVRDILAGDTEGRCIFKEALLQTVLASTGV